ncbi:probable Restriction of telomere capping protein 1 [Zygosaccharomyces bailii]|nr:probable Restriction of telomere capping protein 1 [Zygosaccharomyces bailii]
MSNRPVPRNQAGFSFGRNEMKPTSFGRSSFRIQHYSNSSQMSPVGSSPRTRMSPRYSFTGSVSFNESNLKESMFYDEKGKKEEVVPKSSGLSYSTVSSKELSSIDRINDPTLNSIICAGKTHLGLYKFSSEDNSIACVHDFMSSGYDTNRSASFHTGLAKRSKRTKLSTIADVKAGFHNHKNYVAVCGTSTSISIYDINKTNSMDNPVVTNLSQHTRSINSFDFNTAQSNLIISGGQDACIKIWDLRSSRSKTLNRSDVNINTASDSIRDVKWMPNQNFARMGSQSEMRSVGTAGYKFASIHDSGLLLTFDLRQPNQVEKRINAHSGPGLCLNWHPYQDYISTGGRDGKCCLWYVGENKPLSEFSPNGSTFTATPHSATPNLAANLLVLPETTINCGFPVTKLKVRPCYERKILNSMIAMSSMAEDFGVSIYSVARKYIPKYNLSTSSPSLGFVWWDENLIFNIDKEYKINGWYVNKEPTVLANMSKNITGWRDIEGNGLLFVDQDRGSYEVGDDMPINIEDTKKPANHRISMSSLNAVSSNSGVIGSIKKGISQTGLTSLSGERPTIGKTPANFSSKSMATQPMNLSHNNSVSSYPGLSLHNELPGCENVSSPFLVTLDLPYILNNMRISQLPPDKKFFNSPEVMAIKESPVKVFKFLAKELEFSYMQERRGGDVKSVTQQSNTNEDTTKKDLMEKFGLSENTTWTALISKKGEVAESESGKKDAPVKDYADSSAGSDAESADKGLHLDKVTSNVLSGDKPKLDKANELNIEVQERIDTLLELIPICDHNAAVYSYIDDLPNFKIWISIRDSLLWDLKGLSMDYPEGRASASQSTEDKQMGQQYSIGNDPPESVTSEIRSYITSDLNSFVEEQPKALRSDSDGQKDNKKPISNLQKQLTKIRESETVFEGTLANERRIVDAPEASHKYDTPKLPENRVSNDSESDVIEDEDEDKPGSPSQGIPILNKRKPRRSFIDTYMSGMKSSVGSNGESDTGLSKSRNSQSFGHSSPGSRMSPIASIGSAEFNPSNFKKIASRADRRSSGSLFMSPLKRKELFATEKSSKPSIERKSSIAPEQVSSLSLPPWNTRKLLKQIYKQAVEMGNTLLVVNILFLFQNLYQVTTTEVVKNSLAQFISILHRYELFELSAAILKYSPWEVVVNADGGQSLVPLFCERCGKLITNELSKERFTLEAHQEGNPLPLGKMGYWYCDSCKKPNTLCVLCERPMKTLTMCLLECGHEGHFECLKSWFLDEGMAECPGGCMNQVRL